MNFAWMALMAIVIDLLCGELRFGHPLVAFGRWARAIERHMYRDGRMSGTLAWLLAVLPPCLLAYAATALAAVWSVWAAVAVHVLLLYVTLGLKSLADHAAPVIAALRGDDLAEARRAVGLIVSRDTQALDDRQVAAAGTESMLENGNDAVFGALFWFALLGGPGAVVFRAANTLDAMWGYRTPRYLHFGWAAARIDDVLNYLPARLTALSYALCGRTRTALRCWRTQAPRWESPNAGPVMASGAGALGVQLGGPAPYRGEWIDRPVLGEGHAPDAESIFRAVRLVRMGVILWLLAMLLLAQVWRHA